MKIFIYSILFTLLLIGCNDDFLDREPLDRISGEAVFSDAALAEAYMYRTYNLIQNGYGFLNYSTPGVDTLGYTDQGAYVFDCLSDVLSNKSGWPTSNSTIIPGQIFPTTSLPGLDIWERAYLAIRLSHSIIDGMEESDLDPDYIERITSEARFVRAFMYYDLVRRYGDVPLITKLQTLEDINSLMVSRNPAAEIYAFIDDELSEIANILPSVKDLPAEELGRATQEACWAINGRAQLWAKNYARSAEMSQLVINSQNYELASDYNALFQSYGGNKEVIFEILFDGADKGHCFDALAYPFSYRTDWGSQFLPTNEMVESYEMTNGLPITDPASGYDPENPFVNRDSRLAGSVLYHGNVFQGDTFLCALSSDTDLLPSDVDAPGLTGNHTTTGFYLKKMLDESLGFGPTFGSSKTSWKEIRLAEVLLNYAEAQNEAAGPDQSVYDAINIVRNRADQPNLPTGLSKAEMFDRIVQERKVELFAEGFRYWDLKRWKMAVDVLHGKKAHGLFITKDANNPTNLSYEIIVANNRPVYVFLEPFYLLPLLQEEMDKNSNLTQNPGY